MSILTGLHFLLFILWSCEDYLQCTALHHGYIQGTAGKEHYVNAEIIAFTAQYHSFYILIFMLLPSNNIAFTTALSTLSLEGQALLLSAFGEDRLWTDIDTVESKMNRN